MNFLDELIELGYAARTKLEFHTNGTKYTAKVDRLLTKGNWKYVCAFLSLDAVGAKAEWLRYGSKWDDIVDNVAKFKKSADYVEVQCILSVLNIADLPALDEFCSQHNIPLKLMTLAEPRYMSLTSWPGDPAAVAERVQLTASGFDQYYDIIGTEPDPDAVKKLREYIQQFDAIRTPLRDADAGLADAIGL